MGVEVRPGWGSVEIRDRSSQLSCGGDALLAGFSRRAPVVVGKGAPPRVRQCRRKWKGSIGRRSARSGEERSEVVTVPIVRIRVFRGLGGVGSAVRGYRFVPASF